MLLFHFSKYCLVFGTFFCFIDKQLKQKTKKQKLPKTEYVKKTSHHIAININTFNELPHVSSLQISVPKEVPAQVFPLRHIRLRIRVPSPQVTLQRPSGVHGPHAKISLPCQCGTF